MAWTAPRTWTTGEMVTAALLNLHIRDNQTMLLAHPHTGSAGDGTKNMHALTITLVTTAAAAPSGGDDVMVYGSNDLLHWRNSTGTQSIAVVGHAHGGL